MSEVRMDSDSIKLCNEVSRLLEIVRDEPEDPRFVAETELAHASDALHRAIGALFFVVETGLPARALQLCAEPFEARFLLGGPAQVAAVVSATAGQGAIEWLRIGPRRLELFLNFTARNPMRVQTVDAVDLVLLVRMGDYMAEEAVPYSGRVNQLRELALDYRMSVQEVVNGLTHLPKLVASSFPAVSTQCS